MRYWSPLAAHAAWMTRLREFIYGSGHLDAETVARDDACEIGRWLNGEGAKYGNLSDYQHARRIHAAFHRRAARVVIMVERGRRQEAAADLATGGELRRLSGVLAQTFNRLNKKILASKHPSAVA